jgi:hypothetical protein
MEGSKTGERQCISGSGVHPGGRVFFQPARTEKSNTYPPGRKVSDRDFARVQLRRDQFHGEWNYEIRPTCRNN